MIFRRHLGRSRRGNCDRQRTQTTRPTLTRRFVPIPFNRAQISSSISSTALRAARIQLPLAANERSRPSLHLREPGTILARRGGRVGRGVRARHRLVAAKPDRRQRGAVCLRWRRVESPQSRAAGKAVEAPPATTADVVSAVWLKGSRKIHRWLGRRGFCSRPLAPIRARVTGTPCRSVDFAGNSPSTPDYHLGGV